MSREIVNSVRNRLNNELYFMNDDWLNECVEYFITERHTGHANTKEVAEFVRAQWLLSDLREINTIKGTLPEKLAEKKLFVLPASYILQVNEMVDISQSKYKQLQVMRKVNTFNLEVTEEDNNIENSWQTKEVAKRMMHLKMTDGVQDVVGMEYSPIPLLNEMLHPGCKVLIKGPVKSRNGVLFLKEANIESKGGEVDRLLIPNAVENLLARAIKKPENPDPYNDNVAVTNEQARVTNDQTTATNEQVDPDIDALFLDDDFDVNMDDIVNIEESHMQNNTATSNANRASTAVLEEINERQESYVETREMERLEEEHRRELLGAEVQEISSDEDGCPPNVIEPGRRNEDMDQMWEAELECIDLDRLEGDERGRSPYVTEPGGQDTDAFAVCSEIGISKLSVGNEENRSVTERNISRSKATNKSKRHNSLSDVLREKITSTKTMEIKARIAVMASLTKEKSSWIYNCSISDGTASMDVKFPNKILEKIIGLPAKQFSQKRKQKSDPQIYQELQTILRRAELTLQAIEILEIRMKEGKKAEVVQISELTETEKEAIEIQLRNMR